MVTGKGDWVHLRSENAYRVCITLRCVNVNSVTKDLPAIDDV